jgi:hypothetical protein
MGAAMKKLKATCNQVWGFVLIAVFCAAAWADCVEPPQGKTITIEITRCDDVVADTNEDVKRYAGDLATSWNLRKLYTGALIRDKAGSLWMYPSEMKGVCKQFENTKSFEKKAYTTCCDSGRRGKCVFGGRFLGDVDGKPINAFQ